MDLFLPFHKYYGVFIIYMAQLDSNRRVKVSDFGFSVIKKPNDPREEPNPLGTPLYMAPEVMMCKKYDGFKADVYAFGNRSIQSESD